MKGEVAFRAAFREGSRARGRLLVVLARWNWLPESRLGVSVGKRIVKSSPGRNRLKRLVREAFRLRREHLPMGVDLVVLPQVPPSEFRFEAVAEELERLARQAEGRLSRASPEARPRPAEPRP